MDDLWGNAWSDPAPATGGSSHETKRTKIADSPIWSAADDDDEIPNLSVGSATSAAFAASWAAPTSNSSDLGWGTEDLRADIAKHSGWGTSISSAGGWGEEEIDEHGMGDRRDVQEGTVSEVDIEGMDFKEDTGVTGILPEPGVTARSAGSIDTDETSPSASDSDRNPPIPSLSTHPPEPIVFQSPDPPTPRAAALSFAVPPSPDGFGTFESGVTGDPSHAAPWSPQATLSLSLPVVADVDQSGWGSTWTGRHPEESSTGDEWSSTRESHGEMQRCVPSEVADLILAQWAEFSVDVLSPSSGDPDIVKDEDPDMGVREMGRMATFLDDFVPDITLPQYIPFHSTVTCKNFQGALRASKHLPVSRASPLSHLYASKGSLAWENSVRSRTEPVEDDWAWMGGKPAEPTPVVEAKAAAPAPKKSGLLSFFGRSSSANSADQPTPSSPATTSPSPSLSSPPIQTRSSTESSPALVLPTSPAPGQSMDKMRSSESLSTAIVEPVPTMVESAAVAPTPTPLSLTPSPFTPFPTEASPEVADPTAAAPSAVSRFLGRFSRTRSASPGNHQIALSSSDLSFLDDIPSHADGDDEEEMKAFEGLLAGKTMSPKPPQLPAKLPMPLAPPPKPSRHTPTPSSASGPPANVPNVQGAEEDIWAAFTTPKPPTNAPTLNPRPVSSTPGAILHPVSRSQTPSSTSARYSVPILAPPPKSGTSTPERSNTPKLPPPPLRFPASTSRSSSPAPAARRQNSSSSIVLPPPPPSTQGSHLRSSTSSLSILSTPQTLAPAQSALSVPSSNEFDDFADFIDASPATPSFPSPTPITPSGSAMKIKLLPPIITSATPIAATFDDQFMSPPQESVGGPLANDDPFGDFMSQTANRSYPSSGLPSPRLSAPKTPLNVPEKPLPPKKPRSQATLQVKASQKVGRWPAPPSPLPDAIAPPLPLLPKPGGGLYGASGSGFDDLLGDSPSKIANEDQMEYPFPVTPPSAPSGNAPLGLDLSGLTSKPIPSIPPSSSTVSTATPFPPPPSFSQPMLLSKPTPSFASAPMPVFSSLPQAPLLNTASAGKDGKLSAQDLSFFEGL